VNVVDWFETMIGETMTALSWWQQGVIYQVYPRSFQDRNGDGIGDLAGITARLEYLAVLGVDAVWLSPIYPSPMADFGYDIADYCAIDPVYGSLQDFDRLIDHAHRLGLKVLLDFVPNHTSDQHRWFIESRASRDNPKRDWYLWRDPASDGGPPNNWLSRMGGSAWQWDAASGQYYYHAFLPQQPDLNWRNPAVRAAMEGVLRFWLERGVDGFRVDVLWLLIKDAPFRDNPLNPFFKPGGPEHHRQLHTYTEDRPEVHDIVRAMRRTLDSYGERVLIGEIYLPVPQLVSYYGKSSDGAHMPFNFQLITAQWTASHIAAIVSAYERALPVHAWPNWVLGNHDNPRVASRIGASQARVAAMLLLTLRGTPTLYYGDEIGMTDVDIPPERVRDPAGLRQPGLGQGRDPERTPMQWDASLNAGFTEGEPWLPVGDAGAVNVASQNGAASSLLSLYRRLLSLRRSEPALVAGTLERVAAHEDVLTFERRLGDIRLFVALNMGASVSTLPAPAGRVLLSTSEAHDGSDVVGELTLQGGEAVVIACDRAAAGSPA
jgi:alpha-glucosidase